MPAAITKNNLPGSILKTTSIETVNPAQEEIKEEYSKEEHNAQRESTRRQAHEQTV